MTRPSSVGSAAPAYVPETEAPEQPKAAPPPRPGYVAPQNQVSSAPKGRGEQGWIEGEVQGFREIWKREWGMGALVTDGNVSQILTSMKSLSPTAFGAVLHELEGQEKLKPLLAEMEPSELKKFLKMSETKGAITREPTAPGLIRNEDHLPSGMKALVRDANLITARSSAGETGPLREPGSGEVLIGKLEFDWAEGVKDTVTQYLHNKNEGLDTTARILNLRPGEEVKFEVEVGASYGKSISARGTVGVKQSANGRFEVEMGAEALAGLNHAGFKVLGGLDGRACFSFASAEEAALAGQIAKDLMGANPVAAAAALMPGRRDFLAKHLTAVELGPKGMAKYEAHLKLPGHKLGFDGAASVTPSARLELKDGKPVELIANLNGTVEVEGGLTSHGAQVAGRALGGRAGQALFGKLFGQAPIPNAKGEVSFKYERHFELDEKREVKRELASTATLKLDGSVGAGTDRTGGETEVKFTRDPKQVEVAIAALLAADYATAARALSGPYESQTTFYRTRGESFGDSVDVAGYGATLKLSTQTRTITSRQATQGTL